MLLFAALCKLKQQLAQTIFQQQLWLPCNKPNVYVLLVLCGAHAMIARPSHCWFMCFFVQARPLTWWSALCRCGLLLALSLLSGVLPDVLNVHGFHPLRLLICNAAQYILKKELLKLLILPFLFIQVYGLGFVYTHVDNLETPGPLSWWSYGSVGCAWNWK